MKVKSILALLLVVCSIGIGYAQQITVKGQVWDEVLNEPLIGVNVTVKGTTNGVITDMDGNFSIKAQKNQVLVFSFIGYKDVEIVVKPNLNLSKVVMSENMQQIDEVVVVGYGQQKKASSVGSIATAKGDDLLKVGSVTTVSEALQGQMPGVVAINTSSKPGVRYASSSAAYAPAAVASGRAAAATDCRWSHCSALHTGSAHRCYLHRDGIRHFRT